MPMTDFDGDDEHPPLARPRINWGLDEAAPNTIEALELAEKELFLEKLVQGFEPLNAGLSIGWSPAHTKRVTTDPDMISLIATVRDIHDGDVRRSLLLQTMAGNMTAIQMWLYNRRPDEWKDTKRIVVERSEKISIELVHSVKQSALELLREAGVAALQPGGPLDIIDAEVIE